MKILKKIRSLRLDKIVLDSNGNCKLLNTTESATSDIGCDHNSHVDFWSFGTAVYKMISGNIPFLAFEIGFSEVIQLPNLDQFQISLECKDFIPSLLTKDKSKRLGSHRNSNQAKNHPYFKNDCFFVLMFLFNNGYLCVYISHLV